MVGTADAPTVPDDEAMDAGSNSLLKGSGEGEKIRIRAEKSDVFLRRIRLVP